jgi:uncharacterized membrane protein
MRNIVFGAILFSIVAIIGAAQSVAGESKVYTFTVFICSTELAARDCKKDTADEVIEVLQGRTLTDCSVGGAKAIGLIDMHDTTGKQVIMRCVPTLRSKYFKSKGDEI